MPATSRVDEALIALLLERLAKVADFNEAGSIVLDAVAQECGLERAVLAAHARGEVAAVGSGVARERVAEFVEIARDPDTPFESLLRLSPDGGPVEAELFPQLGFLCCFGAALDTGRREVTAVFLADADPDTVPDFALELLRRCAPSIGCAFELDRRNQQLTRITTQRDLLTSILDGLPDPVLLTNSDNDVLLANRRADQLLSTTADSSEGRRRAVQINNLLFSSFLTQVAMDEPGAAGRELNLVDPVEGSDLLFEVLTLPSRAGSEGAVISILRDITDLRRAVNEVEAQFSRSRAAEVTARRERDRLNVVLENVSDPILVTDDQSNIVLLNKEADRLFVVPSGVDQEVHYWKLVRANGTVFTTMISDFLLQEHRRRVEKVSLVDPETGRRFPAEVVSTKILNSRAETTAIVSVLHDLTQVAENERLASELQQLNDDLEDRIRDATEELEERNRRLEWQSHELERASRLKSEFLANMSHELRTPINVVLGYTSLMRERIYGHLTQQQEEALGKIYGTSQHLLELINDILDLSKIEAGKMPRHIENVDLDALIEELTENVDPMVRKRGIGYRAYVAPEVCVIRTDRTKLKQILLNLVSNAIKFTHEGEVTVEAVQEGDDLVRISVSDTGIGIPPEHLETIFDDFRQVDQSHTREYGGTGLGLSITRKLLAVLGGHIEVKSRHGEGSNFSVLLPRSVAAEEE